MTTFLRNLDLTKIKSRSTKTKIKAKARARSSAQVPLKFPQTLFQMLKETEEQGDGHIVSWQHDGQSFRVHRPGEFVEDILPKYFRCSKMKSFQRQLNFYKFQRVVGGPLEGSYRHPNFIKGEEELAGTIRRVHHDQSPMDCETSSKRSSESSSETTTSDLNDEASFSSGDDQHSSATKDDSEVHPSKDFFRREDSLQVFLESNFGDVERGTRESFRDGKRFSFVGKNFFFLPVEFSDLNGV
jgi:hypothetical protein